MVWVLIAELCHVRLYNLHSRLREIFEHKLFTLQLPLYAQSTTSRDFTSRSPGPSRLAVTS